MKNFKRFIDVIHERRKLSYNESLATNLKLVSLDTNFKQIALYIIILIRNKSWKIDNIVAIVKVA